MPEPRDPLDEVLDDALGTYGIAPKSDDLEARILAQVDERARRARSTKWLVASIAAAAVVLIGCFLGWTARRETIDAPPINTTARAARNVKRPHVPEVLAPAVAVKRPLRRTRITAPKLSRFPAPSAMTSEERALVRLVASAAKNPSLRLYPISGSIKPIRITAIDIKPLGWDR